MICKTIKFELERKSENSSITKVGERLDFRVLLERASAGIIDLRQFQVPRMSDVSGSEVGDPANSQALEDLMNRPASVMDNLFGASVEDAERELEHHKSVLAKYRKSAADDNKEKIDEAKEKKDDQ